MKQKSDELIVINRRFFWMILMAIALVGIVAGYTIGYITTPVKEVYIQKTNDSEKTVLPATVETAHAKKQDSPAQQVETKQEKVTQTNIEEQQKIEQKREIAKGEEQKKTQEIQSQNQTLTQLKKENETSKKPVKIAKHSKHFTYTIQAGAFSDIENAKLIRDKIYQAGYKVYLVTEDLYKVRVGNYGNFTQAKKISQELNSKGFENFIIRVKKSSNGGKP